MTDCKNCPPTKSEIFALIPARSGSKGIRDKNLSKIRNRSLLELSIAAAGLTKLIDKTFVSTDSEMYASIANQYGDISPFLRPQELASDTSTDIEVFEHAINWTWEHLGYCPQLWIHLRPTTPFRDPIVMSNAIEYFKTKLTNSGALRSVHEASESPFKWFRKENEKLLTLDGSPDIEKQNGNRQNFPKVYVPNGYVDIVSTHSIICDKKMHGNNVIGYETLPTVEIDSQFDLKVAQKVEFPEIEILLEFFNSSAKNSD